MTISGLELKDLKILYYFRMLKVGVTLGTEDLMKKMLTENPVIQTCILVYNIKS